MSLINYIIPAYQPTTSLIEIVKSLRAITQDPIIVVNDGSDPACDDIFAAIKTHTTEVTILTHPTNKGKGEALKTAFKYSLAHFPNFIGSVTLDADGQHRPEDALQIGAALLKNPASLVLGCREFDKQHKIPLRSQFGNKLTKFVFKTLTGKAVSDTQTGLRGIPKKLMLLLENVTSTGYEFETDMLLLAIKNSLNIFEYQIKTIYIDGNSSSHFNPVMDSLKIYFVLLRSVFSSMLTALIDLVVFSICSFFTNHLLFSLIAGRIVAVCFNFITAKKFVFYSKGNARAELLRYFTLVFTLLTLSNFGIQYVTKNFGYGVIAAKVLVESALFVFSFAVQRFFVFRKVTTPA
jgi:glycosyltransferase involved in cell wall biosynthesis